ncbi:unnamed protein product [Blepharisma stoltei]|uniref:Uncharacterized protein n=1 Tax=Blepharisma stoltei TaxID=1481888 RepID=A0AAU9K6Q6_9CILI|nr:unnamed protein product [Blepharisma stoltei]
MQFSSLHLIYDPLKIVLFSENDFIIWLPESDEIKFIKISYQNDYRLSSYEGNNLAVLYKNNKIVFYSDDGTVRNEISLNKIKNHEVSKMQLLKCGKYQLLRYPPVRLRNSNA